MKTRNITAIERELRTAGHQVDRTLEDGPEPRTAFSDAHWVFRVDGEVVATGRALGPLEDAVRTWLEREPGNRPE